MTNVAVLYLDLDGTVRQGKDDALGRFVNGPGDVRVFPEAIAQMRRWTGRIVGISNQGGIALGLVSFRDVADAMWETDRQCGRLFDKMSFCIHHPRATDPEMARCWCRKPSPGLVIEAAIAMGQTWGDEAYPPHMALLVGDRAEDRECARLAGIDFMPAHLWRAEVQGMKQL